MTLFVKSVIRTANVCTIYIYDSIGEPGNAFYVLIRGQVSISIPMQRIEEQKNSKTNEKTKITYMQEVNVLKDGSHFGELALLNDAPRTATIICKEDCDFAVLFRKDFKDVLGTLCYGCYSIYLTLTIS